MNDKCASGTGATIDKCVIKVGMPRELRLPPWRSTRRKLHHVAAKCGVFAETDIVNLVKSGIPRNEIINSLADAIVQPEPRRAHARQHAARASVLLLGGPNTYLPFLQQCWRMRIPESWDERGYDYPTRRADRGADLRPQERRPLRGLRRGAVRHARAGRRSAATAASSRCDEFIAHGRKAKLGDKAGPGLVHDEAQQDAFVDKYKIPRFTRPSLEPGKRGARRHRPRRRLDVVEVRAHRRAARTSSRRSTQLSKGNPIQDMKDMFVEHAGVGRRSRGPRWTSLAFGVTGYAGDVLERSLAADANIVETVAHMMSAKHCFPNVDVICDIGGQDIKVLFMQNGDVKNFRLSNSCSAGNGMLLQAMADQFGLPVKRVRRRRVPGPAGAQVQLRLRRVPRLRPRELPEGGLRARGAARGAGAGAAQEHLAVRRADPAHGRARARVRAPGRHAAQHGRAQGPGRLHREARARRRGVRAPAHGRGRRARRGHGGAARGPAPRALDVRRSRPGDRHRLHLDQRRDDALRLLPEQLLAHVHRHRDHGRHDRALHLGLLVREGHGREHGRAARSSTRTASSA